MTKGDDRIDEGLGRLRGITPSQPLEVGKLIAKAAREGRRRFVWRTTAGLLAIAALVALGVTLWLSARALRIEAKLADDIIRAELKGRRP